MTRKVLFSDSHIDHKPGCDEQFDKLNASHRGEHNTNSRLSIGPIII